MAYQSLYRRFRPQRFADVVGQDHLVAALRNAVAADRVGHAYLLSGPRGTGKTSTARVLAKALNCEQPQPDGEPCCGCDECRQIEAGSSLTLLEVDAASNNSVQSVRALTERAHLAGVGRWKVYLLDEVHMLSNAASNALLKTLEEPPEQVVFILATTDPQKVLPTIRSRTQHIELNLIGAATLTEHVRQVARAADLAVDDETVSHVVTAAAGSVRDALSTLDQVITAGGVIDRSADGTDLVTALANLDTDAALAAVAVACESGADAGALTRHAATLLRDMLLTLHGSTPADLPQVVADRLRSEGQHLGTAGTVTVLRHIGDAFTHMAASHDRRLTLEVAALAALTELQGSTEPTATSTPTTTAGQIQQAPLAAQQSTPAPADPPQEPPETAAPAPVETPAAATSPPQQPTDSSTPEPEPPPAAPPDTENGGGELTLGTVHARWGDALALLNPFQKASFVAGAAETVTGNQVTVKPSPTAPPNTVTQHTGVLADALSTVLRQPVTVTLAGIPTAPAEPPAQPAATPPEQPAAVEPSPAPDEPPEDAPQAPEQAPEAEPPARAEPEEEEHQPPPPDATGDPGWHLTEEHHDPDAPPPEPADRSTDWAVKMVMDAFPGTVVVQ